MKAGVKVRLVGIGSLFGVKNTGKCFEIARRLITCHVANYTVS